MKRLLLAAFLLLASVPALAQGNPQCPTRPLGDDTNACASTAFVGNAIGAGAGGTSGQIQYNNSGAFGGFTASGAATIDTSTGVVTLAGNAIPLIPSRATASTLDLSAYTGIIVQGYTTPGDGGQMAMTKVASQPFCGAYTNTAAFQDTAGNWWNISEPYAYTVQQFGAKFDWDGVDGSATDDTTAIQSALNCAGVQNSAGNDVGGGQGRPVLLPAASGLVSSTLTVPNQVIVRGAGTYSSVLKMATGFDNAAHFTILGTQYSETDVAALQSRGSAGNLTINGVMIRSGVAYFLQPTLPAIFSASDNSGVSFTITGTDRYGAALVDTFIGPTAGSYSESTEYFSTITQVATDMATVGTVSVGARQVASFASRLEELQLFSDIITASSGASMVYTSSAQHTGGIKAAKIFAGNRSATYFTTGTGGASYFVFQDVEGFNQGNCGGCSSNNPIFYFNYDGLQTPLQHVVAQGPGASGGAGAIGIEIASGFVYMFNFHCEGIATCVNISTATANNGYTILQNGIGGSAMTDFIKIQAAVDANTVTVQGMYPNGATNAIDNRGVPVVGNVFAWTTY